MIQNSLNLLEFILMSNQNFEFYVQLTIDAVQSTVLKINN